MIQRSSPAERRRNLLRAILSSTTAAKDEIFAAQDKCDYLPFDGDPRAREISLMLNCVRASLERIDNAIRSETEL